MRLPGPWAAVDAVAARAAALRAVDFLARPLPPRHRHLIGGIALAAFLVTSWFLADRLIETTNLQSSAQDQHHNMVLADRLQERRAQPGASFFTRVPAMTDGVVSPLWTWVASHLHPELDPPEQAESFFRRGKWFNVTLSLVFLLGLGGFALRRFSLAGSLTLVTVAGLGALLPRSVYFQPEPLFYLLFFGAWVAAMSILRGDRLWPYPVLGACAALAYLAKSSALALLLAFGCVWLLRLSVTWWRQRSWRDLLPHLAGAGTAAAIFLLLCTPMFLRSHQVFGDPMHSFPKYWMWFDDFDPAFTWMVAHGNKAKLEAIPPHELPSFSNYRKTHRPGEMFERLRSGTVKCVQGLLFPKELKPSKKGPPKPWQNLLPGRGQHVLLLFTLVLGLTITLGVNRRGWPLSLSDVAPALFVLACLVGYSLAYGWYEPVGRGDRFMLSLFLPLVFSLVWAAETLRERLAGIRWVNLAHLAVHTVILAAVTWRLLELIQHPVFREGVR